MSHRSKRKLIDLVRQGKGDEAQESQAPTKLLADQDDRHDGDEEEEEEDDFMSDRYLTSATPQVGLETSTSKRPRFLPSHQEPKDEETQRFLGLSKNLMEGVREGGKEDDSKAMKMMRLMGYEPGQALGVDSRKDDSIQHLKGSDEESTQDTLSKKAATPTSKGDQSVVSTSHLLEPILPNTFRLGSAQSARRGIGSLTTVISKAAKAHAEREEFKKELSSQVEDYRARAALQAREAHERRLLEKARKTCWELDTRRTEEEIEYSPLWLDERWFSSKSEELPQDITAVVATAMGEEEVEASEGRKVPLDGDDIVDVERTGETLTRRLQTRQFLSLPISTRLAITLDHLRSRHWYCLFCGVQYGSREELEQECPGEEEDAHD